MAKWMRRGARRSQAQLRDDAALRARLDRLKLDKAQLGQAFDLLLAGAPKDRLAAMLARAEAAATAARPASAGGALC